MKVKDLNWKEQDYECENCNDTMEDADVNEASILTVTFDIVDEENYICFGEVAFEDKQYLITTLPIDEEDEVMIIQEIEQHGEEIIYEDVTDESLKQNIFDLFQKRVELHKDVMECLFAYEENDGENVILNVYGEIIYEGKKYLLATPMPLIIFESVNDSEEIVDIVIDTELEGKIIDKYFSKV